MTVYEPATLLTDMLLGALAAWLAWRLHRNPAAARPAVRWWRLVLGLTALSAFVGGSYHGFAPDFPTPVASAWWLVTLWIISLLSAGMAMTLLHELAPAGNQRLWRGLIGLKLALFAAVAVMQPVFVVVIIDYGLVMAAWAVAALVLRRAWRDWMLAGLGLSVIAALVQQLSWAPSPHFNHNDLYHVIQALALGAFYRAGLKFAGPPRADR